MKSRTKFLSLIVIITAFSALAFRDGDSRNSEPRRVVLPAGEVHEGWYFASGDQVSIQGTVNGDAYVAGGVVEVDGTINGDLIVAGGQVTIAGTVTDNIRGAGGMIRLDGAVGKSVTAAGGSVVVGRSATIARNLLAAGGSLQLNGTIGQEARVAAGDVQGSGALKSNLQAACSRLVVDKGASIAGNLAVMTDDKENIKIEQGAVSGSVEISTREQQEGARFLGMSMGTFWFKLLFLLSLLVTTIVFVFVLPRQTEEMGTLIVRRPGQTALWGILVLVLAPVATIILFATVIGIPLGLFLLFLYLWFLYLTQVAAGATLGLALFRSEGRRGWRLFGPIALGIVIVQILVPIPILGVLVLIAAFIFGLGSLSIILKEGIAARTSG
jgi:hypothetical protein